MPSIYPGNSSLSSAVKERVVNTFEQTIALYKQGRTDEVVAGCGLILRMDPLFDPAKKLLEKARNPSVPIDVDTLVPTSTASDGIRQAREALATRDFTRALNITTDILTNDLTNEEARILADEAREKMEAAPFVEQFVRKFDTHLGNRNIPAAKSELEKARALDAGHPAIAKMEQMLAQASAPVQPAAAAPPPPPPPQPPPPAQPASPQGFSFDAPPSFVVDQAAPPAAGRTAAQAADFGFTFEEEKPAAPPEAEPPAFSFDTPSTFSFDAPAAPPAAPAAPRATPAAAPPPPADTGAFNFGGAPVGGKAPATGEFDFTTASIETSPEDQQKIAQYLSEGDRAFDSGDYQQAIDIWSRVFLIDVTNEQASERIDKAKVKRREIEQQLESVVAAGMTAFEHNDFATARAKFDEVLRLDPTNPTAHEYIGRLDEGAAADTAARVIPPSRPAAPGRDIFDDEELSAPYPAPAAIPAPAKKPAAKPAAPSKAGKPLPVGLIATVLAVIVVGAAGWFGWTKFMNRPQPNRAAAESLMKQAQTLAKGGKYDQAIALLRDVRADDPLHDRALGMIADLQKKRAQAAETVDGRPAAVVYQEGLTQGKTALDAHDYEGAKRAFESAQRVKPLPPDMKALYDTASQQVAKLDSAHALFKERKFQDALTSLQQLQQQDPQNQNIARLIVDAHFNLGAMALQEERLPDAMREFDEVLKADPNDEVAKRSRTLAERYNGQTKDLMYKIYVKYLPMRQVG